MSPEFTPPDSVDPDAPTDHSPLSGLPRQTVALWLVVLGLAIFLLPLLLTAASIRGDMGRAQASLIAIEATLTVDLTPDLETQQLQASLAQLREAISAVSSSLPAGQPNWPGIMAAIHQYDPSQIELTSLKLADGLLTLTGRASADTAAVAYANALEESDAIARVAVQSIRLLPLPPATATSPPTSPPSLPITPTLTFTPTPDLSDAYEVDDFQPREIFLNTLQSRSFYPVFDVDRVTFLAKAGRYYRVFTTDLAPGVDTFLTVNVDGQSYANDDRQPGDLSSSVTFQVGPAADLEVSVTITNRGQYGPDKNYQISVVEQLATPTATPAHTATSTPSATATPTATPDLRDAYEPDDLELRAIAVGETQSHNFYPDLDVDSVLLLAKAGKSYRVFTSGLALGVDTVMAVNVDGIVYTNDDRAPGDLSSEVTFQIHGASDIQVLITVANRGQFGPDKWYQVTVVEVTSLSAAPGAAKPPGLARLAAPPRRAPSAPAADRQAVRRSLLIEPGAVEFVLVLEPASGP